MKKGFWARRVALFILFAAIAIFVFGGVVMLLWNNVLAQVTHVSAITFIQALGILVLAKILFGGFRGGWGPRRYYWKQRMRDKWNNMTPEEREKFKQEWQKRCGSWGYKSWYDTTSSQRPEATPESRVQNSEL
jgi:Ca2+/H+ antiporter, TMEM165/GDT1 family